MFSCKKCGKKFAKLTLYTMHLSVPNCQPYVCEYCCKKFTTSHLLKRHTKVYNCHDKKPIYKCLNCDESFSKKQGLNLHAKTHFKEYPYFCNICAKRFSKENERKVHFQTHIDEIPFYCKECNIPFRDQSSLEYHLKNHAELLCEFCDLKFRSQTFLDLHMMSNHREKTSKFCIVCVRPFDQNCTMKCYLLSNTPVKKINCSKCDVKFDSIDSLFEHRYKMHSNNLDTGFIYQNIYTEILVCQICGELSDSKKALHSHYKIHASACDQNRTFCNICNKTFDEKCSLICYLKSDTGPKWLNCNHCDKKFKSVKSLHRHFISDFNLVDNPDGFGCNPREKIDNSLEECNSVPPLLNGDPVPELLNVNPVPPQLNIDPIATQLIGDPILRKKRSKLSTGMFSCKLCTKRFMHYLSLENHRKKHDLNDLYTCDFCSKMFIEWDEYIKHLQKHS